MKHIRTDRVSGAEGVTYPPPWIHTPAAAVSLPAAQLQVRDAAVRRDASLFPFRDPIAGN